MEDHNKFDDYIKKTLNEDWQMPEDLQWDQMDIDLPEQKKKRRFLLWIPFLVGLGFLSILTFKFIEKSSLSDTITTNSTTEEIDQPVAEMAQEEMATTGIEKSTNTLKEPTKINSSEDLPSEVIPSTNNNQTQTQTASNLRPAKVVPPAQRVSPVLENTIDPIAANANLEEAENEVKEIHMDKKEEEINSQRQLDALVLGTDKIDSPVLNIINPFDQLETMPISPLADVTFSFYPRVFDLEENQKKTMNSKTGISLTFLAGANTQQIKIDSDSPLKGKQAAAYGRSFAILLQKNIKNNFTLSGGLSYDELHSTFEHHREINTEIDYARRVKVITCETTFHNNFTKIASLNLGANRQFHLGQRFQIHVGALLAPNYILGAEGKTLEGEEIVDLADRPMDKRMFFSFGANAGMTIKLHERISIVSQYQYARFTGKGLVLDNGVNATGIQRLQLGLALKW